MNRLNKAQKDKITQFRGILGSSEKIAYDCLRAQGWSLEAAIDYFYSMGHVGSGPSVDQAAIDALFQKYKDAGSDIIGVDGITSLCADLGVDPADIVMLVLAFHLKADIMCEFTKEEWGGGLARLGCDSLEKLRSKLPELRSELRDPERHRDIYTYAFSFAREKGQKCLQLETALGMWQLLLSGDREWPLLGDWCEFLQTHHNRAISRDTWVQLYDFVVQIKPDFSNFDESSAWPYLLDEFVEYMNEKRDKQ